jgi:hypothetical protein
MAAVVARSGLGVTQVGLGVWNEAGHWARSTDQAMAGPGCGLGEAAQSGSRSSLCMLVSAAGRVCLGVAGVQGGFRLRVKGMAS